MISRPRHVRHADVGAGNFLLNHALDFFCRDQKNSFLKLKAFLKAFLFGSNLLRQAAADF